VADLADTGMWMSMDWKASGYLASHIGFPQPLANIRRVSTT